ncbi:uncharacterized protein LOC131014733 [Salvia miltiorrhiza]|uniref:uncharacterized protein LOC131014733 n=1 Tax=Salvia miltiorrhiza TaxID=226208 RepID=UPI0025AC44CF|nr:uncharacterized protein LOC131014733 [Salvia miltiorrhiza]
MNPRIKSLAMLLLLIFLSAGLVKGSNHIAMNPPHKGGNGANSRKLLGIDIVLDYDYAGPNGKHDPRGRKGGKGP